MTEFEVVARSPEQAKQKVAALHGAAVDSLEVTSEYEPDEVDLGRLAEEEAANPALKIEGEPVLYQLKSGMTTYIARARDVASRVLGYMAEGVTVECVAFGHGLLIRIDAPDPSFLIGKGGASLDALQHVVSRCCNSKDETFPDIIVDVGGYREKRLLRLGHDASEAAHKALEAKRGIALEPMNPIERKYIHNMLKKIPGIVTKSEGFEPARYIIVSVPDAQDDAIPPPKKVEGRHGRRGRRGGDRHEGGGGGGHHRHQGGGGGGRHNREHNRGGGGGGQRFRDRDDRGNRAPLASPVGEEVERNFNREQPPPPDYSREGGYGNRGGGGGGWRKRGGRGNQRTNDGRMKPNEQFDPTRHIDYAGLPKITAEEEEAAYRDVAIEGRQSRLPAYREPERSPDMDDPNRKMVDELE